ncbi:hypothetical protein ABZT17_18895 [Streptomyces sp. NPDC005648]|uniref:hypothetical protein n=1 Tax=Streptomyces sp. NPDC005648 TaxID=3157044 RepID=UPI0033B20A74
MTEQVEAALRAAGEEEAMGWAIALSALLITGAVVAAVALRRAGEPEATSQLDAEAEANRWLIRLGAGLIPPGATAWVSAGEEAGQALTRAAECHRTARALLAEARTAAEYERVTRMARDGLAHVRTARQALGLAADAPAPAAVEPTERVQQALHGAFLENGSNSTTVSAAL